ncbi:uncharacterized protein KY384_001847 [Bacidia gigantensis]|uniref:uncharacterized protein n=1 Tax=Bacidia gigantensis TaxID=2732470 RepID=UPI001D05A09A|nr:uncharacterized protein KY384_001847 [Bacidia gigantensis]KAG8533064.1 hypothetical protein KY384_001847 [Bacidia gigantensis]
MAGVKHSLNITEPSDASTVMPMTSESPFLSLFEGFRGELDEHHDRRERVVKASRDITALSKKIVTTLAAPIALSIEKAITPHRDQISALFTAVAPDLTGPNAWRYHHQITGGIQEYIEATAFYHYLSTQTLLSFSSAQDLIPAGVLLTEDDYLLGLFDMVGEIMRFAITTMATSGALPAGEGVGRDVVGDLRGLRAAFETFVLDPKSGKGKMDVMRTCVQKVEQAMYGMIIRGRERPKGWVPELEGEGGGKKSRATRKMKDVMCKMRR